MEPLFSDFVNASLKNGASYAIHHYKIEAADKKRHVFAEKEINDLGYRFLNDLNRLDDAVEIFKFNIFLYPNSANAYDSLGEAYFIRGELALAKLNYKKSLAMNAANKNAQHMLRQLNFIH